METFARAAWRTRKLLFAFRRCRRNAPSHSPVSSLGLEYGRRCRIGPGGNAQNEQRNRRSAQRRHRSPSAGSPQRGVQERIKRTGAFGSILTILSGSARQPSRGAGSLVIRPGGSDSDDGRQAAIRPGSPRWCRPPPMARQDAATKSTQRSPKPLFARSRRTMNTAGARPSKTRCANSAPCAFAFSHRSDRRPRFRPIGVHLDCSIGHWRVSC